MIINAPKIEKHSLDVIKAELEWLNKLIEYRMTEYFSGNDDYDIFEKVPPIGLEGDSFYVKMLDKYRFKPAERAIILMALSVHIRPNIYDVFFLKNNDLNRGYTEFGGAQGVSHNGFLPTGDTVSFILCGRDIEKRFDLLEFFSDDHPFHKHNILHLTEVKDGEPVFSGTLSISKEFLSLLTQGKSYQPQYSSSFPAKRLSTDLTWEDAVFDEYTYGELEDLRTWIKYGHEIIDNELLSKYLKKGFRALFHGPPGTGKTMTASILGVESGLDVYQVDLSSVVSKYIGETEKNLAHVFDLAENKDWILFFDEADSLFGKRTQTQSSNDQFANQQVGYLLQRIEDYNGMVILATNFKENIDPAFLRRFQSVIYFPKPKAEQRIQLWKKYFSQIFDLQFDLEPIALQYDLSGGAIINVLRYCAIATMRRGNHKLYAEDILAGINKEYRKEGISI